MVEPVRFEGADTSFGRSGSIWGRCPWRAIQDGLVPGVVFFDNFASFPITPATTEGNFGQYAQFSDTGGVIQNLSATAATQGGITIGSNDDNEGASIRTRAAAFMLSQSNKRFWFEACIEASTVAATKFDIFVGLLEDVALTAVVPITATAETLSDNNVVGFMRIGSVGTRIDTTYKSNGNAVVQLQSGAGTMAAATKTKLGMKYEPSGDKDGRYTLSFYQDGTRCTSSYQITATAGNPFPNDVPLGLVFAVVNQAGSSPGTATLHWWAAAQEFA